MDTKEEKLKKIEPYQGQWIDINDADSISLPYDIPVLGFSGGDIYIVTLNSNGFLFQGNEDKSYISHWMPLPFKPHIKY